MGCEKQRQAAPLPARERGGSGPRSPPALSTGGWAAGAEVSIVQLWRSLTECPLRPVVLLADTVVVPRLSAADGRVPKEGGGGLGAAVGGGGRGPRCRPLTTGRRCFTC